MTDAEKSLSNLLNGAEVRVQRTENGTLRATIHQRGAGIRQRCFEVLLVGGAIGLAAFALSSGTQDSSESEKKAVPQRTVLPTIEEDVNFLPDPQEHEAR